MLIELNSPKQIVNLLAWCECCYFFLVEILAIQDTSYDPAEWVESMTEDFSVTEFIRGKWFSHNRDENQAMFWVCKHLNYLSTTEVTLNKKN